MTHESLNLIEQVTHLRQTYTQLSKQLTTAGEVLNTQGTLPQRTLLVNIEQAWTDFTYLVDLLLSMANELNMPDLPTREQIHSLAELDTLAQQINNIQSQQVANQMLAQAMSLIDQASRIRHKENTAFTPLISLQAELSALRKRLQTADQEAIKVADELIQDLHPIGALIELVDHGQSLDDEQCNLLSTRITSKFDQLLATTAVRGKLFIASKIEPESLSGISLDDSDMKQSVEVAPEPLDTPPPSIEPEPDLALIPSDESSMDAETSQIIKENEKDSILNGTINTEEKEEEASQPVDLHDLEDQLQPIDLDDMGHASSAKEEELQPVDLHDLEDQLQPIDLDDLERASSTEDVAKEVQLSEGQRESKTTATDRTVVTTTSADNLEIPSPSDSLSANIAHHILSGRVVDRIARTQELIWQLLDEERYGLAYHLARTTMASDNESYALQPELVRAVALGHIVRQDIGDIAAMLKNDYALLVPVQNGNGVGDLSYAIALLQITATLRASLLAPSTGAYTVLRGVPLPTGLSQLYKLCQITADYGENLQPLNMRALRAVKNKAAWQADLDSLLKEVADWNAQASHRTIRYARASRVWQHWQREDGLIDNLLRPVRSNDTSQLAWVRSETERLSRIEEVRREVNLTDREQFGGRTTIVGRTITQICQYVAQAVALARRWLDLHSIYPGGQQTYFQQQAEQLRIAVVERYTQVQDELTNFEHRYAPLTTAYKSALDACRRELESVRTLFDEDVTLSTEEILPRYVLHTDLLRSTAIDINDDWEPITTGDDLERGLLHIICTVDKTWDQILDMWSDQRDHEQTQRILEVLAIYDYPEIELEQLMKRRDRHLQECRNALQRDIQETERQVEGAVAYGLLRENDRNDYIARIKNIDNQQTDWLRFQDYHDVLSKIRRDIDAERQSRVNDVRQRLDNAQITSQHPAYERIDSVLSQGDVLAANEYIDMVVNNQHLPEAQPQQDIFTEFFPDIVRNLAQFLEDESMSKRFIERTVKEIRDFARARIRSYRVGLLERKNNVAGPQADQAADLLEAWFEAKTIKRLSSTAAQRIAYNLGMLPIACEPDLTAQYRQFYHFRLQTQLTQNKSLCPVYVYGSRARGNYWLMSTWNRPTENEILSEIESGSMSSDSPSIIFYFGRMTEQRRYEFARLCREKKRTCLLIDDLLILYLCTLPAPRLPSLFNCSLPFTYIDPYTTTAGIVPTEIFYGRNNERAQILDPMGSCFIYGGRQLGKTALLRDVEREYHDPDNGRVVLWLDLKVEGIGNDRPIDAIWVLLTRKLRDLVLPEGTSPHINADRLLEYIHEWLEKDTRRRILLLLDEADRFLESDGQEYFQRASKIKGLMDRTERRFKVVFAGLHNVKRTTRQSNHPLAHYGDPICIGPLLENGEWREARALIERPLASAGYRFESSDLITRILSQTNYYPSLIQLYCKRLIEHLTERNSTTPGPPYLITSRHVEEVYQTPKLRKNIRQRFDLTTQLDPRYEVIAYTVAFWSLLDDGKGMVDGFPVALIREQSIAAWPEGFRESAGEDLFLALLDEMVGLGILRVVQDGYFALRSPNVVLLMGTEEEISSNLERKREPPPEYEPATFRAAYRDETNNSKVDVARRSPLTALQISELQTWSNGVSIICGCEAAGLNEVKDFLQITFGTSHFKSIPFSSSRTQFDEELSKLIEKRSDNGTTLVLLEAGNPWSEDWIDNTLDRLQRLRSKSSWVRVAFVANPATIWSLIRQEQFATHKQLHPHASVLTLRPWHDSAVRQWLEDCELVVDHRQEITAVTGNWPWLLKKFYVEATARKSWESALRLLAEQIHSGELQSEFLRQYEFAQLPSYNILHTMAEWSDEGVMTLEDLLSVLDDAHIGLAHQALRWADFLGLVYPEGDSTWRLDPVIQALIKPIR